MRYPSVLISGFAVVALLLSESASAEFLQVIVDDLDTPPPGFTLVTGASPNASASLQIDDVGGSNGLVFTGTWDVPANGQEFAVGALIPVTETTADFQFDPASTGGITGLRWALDLEVISTTMTPGVQGIFAQLVVYQQQPDDTVLAFTDGGNYITAGESTTIDVTAVDTDFGQPGANPDFSASGGPMSFGLQFGAVYPGVTVPEPFFVNGRMNADNWLLFVDTPDVEDGDLFKDGFEEPMMSEPPAAKTVLPPSIDCDCATPSAVPWPLRD